jgi:hypothetical protein
MTYDIAVWKGSLDISDRAAVEEFERRYRESVIRAEAASARIRQNVNALLARYPDTTDRPDDEVDTTPWADGPLIDNAIGDFLYFALSPSRAEEIVPFLADAAWAHGLVCVDRSSSGCPAQRRGSLGAGGDVSGPGGCAPLRSTTRNEISACCRVEATPNCR